MPLTPVNLLSRTRHTFLVLASPGAGDTSVASVASVAWPWLTGLRALDLGVARHGLHCGCEVCGPRCVTEGRGDGLQEGELQSIAAGGDEETVF